MPEANDVEVRAREMGWRNQDEFKGDPDKWVDAEEYVRRGEHVLPLVKAENKRLVERTDEMSREIQRLTQVVAENQNSMRDFAHYAAEQLREKLEDQRRELSARLREARRDEDDAAVAGIEEEIEENRERRQALKAIPKGAAAPAPAAPQKVEETPEYRAWLAKNPWFTGTSRADQAKAAAAERFAIEVAKSGKRGQAFFDGVDAMLEEVYPTPRRTDPAEDGRPSGGGGAGSGKGFAGLPADAKAKAREQVSRFVGPNKMFKTEGDWFAYYAKQYETT